MTTNPTKPNTESMTDVELVMFYVKHSPTPSFDIKERGELISAIYSEVTFAA